MRAILVHAVFDVETLRAAVDLDLTTAERPSLVRGIRLAGLHVDDGPIGGALGGETVVVVQTGLEHGLAREGRRLRRDSHDCGKGEECGEHRDECGLEKSSEKRLRRGNWKSDGEKPVRLRILTHVQACFYTRVLWSGG